MKILKYVAWILGGLVSLLLVVLLLLPMSISTSIGNSLILRLARSAYPGTIAFKSLSVSWLQGVKLTNLLINDEKGRLVASLDELNLDKPLFHFIFSPTDIGTLTIINPKACLYEDKKQPPQTSPLKESSSKHHEKKSTPNASSSPIIIPLSGNIALVNASVQLYKEDSVVGGIQGANLTIKANLPKKVDLSVDALLVSDGIKTPFHADAQGGESSPTSMDGTAKIACNTIPTQLVTLFAKDIDPNLPEMLEQLLGSSFSVQCDASLHGGNLNCKASIQSTHLNSDLSFNYANNLFTLEKGQLLSATCTPTLCTLLSRYFPENVQISLVRDATFSIQNTMPLVLDCNTVSVKAPANITLSSPSQIQLLVGREKQPLTVSINSALTQDSEETHLLNNISAASGTLNALLRTQTAMVVGKKKIDLDSSVSLNGEWPALLEKITLLPASNIIGHSIDFKASCKGFFERLDAFSFSGQSSLSSQNFQHTATFSIDQNSLNVPSADFSANISNALCKTFNLPIRTQNPAESLQIKATISKCTIPLEAGSPNLDTAVIEATTTFSIPNAAILDGQAVTEASSTTCTLVKSRDDTDFQFSIASVLPCTFPKLPAVQVLLGKKGLEVTANGSVNAKTQTLLIKKACLNSCAIAATFTQIEAILSPVLKMKMHEPASISIQCSNDLLGIYASKTSPVTLLSPCALHCSIEPFEVTFDQQVSSKSPLKGSFSTDPIRLSQFKETDSFTLQSPFSFDPNRSKAVLQVVLYQNATSMVDSTSSVDFSGESPKVFSKCSINNLPVSFLEFFAQKKLVESIGSTISSTIDCAFTGLAKSNNIFHISADGEFWKAHIDLALDDMKLHPGKGQACSVEAIVTPQRLQAITELCNSRTDISLLEPTKLTLTVPVCSADISHLLENNPSSLSYFKTLGTASLQCTASITPLKLASKNQSFFSIDSLLATINLFGDKKSLSFSINSPKSQSTSITIEGTLTDAWDDSGLRLDAMNVESSVKVNNFPTATLEIAAPHKGDLFKETLGPNLNLDGVIDVQKMTTGSFTLNCSAKNASVHCDALVEKGILRLKNPAKASLTITKQAGELFLKNIAPFLATAARSEKPLEITIAPEGVAIPIKPFSPTTMRIPNITANLGKLIVKNGGVLKIILGILGQSTAATSEEINLWITPVYASIANGLVTCKRADFLVADSIHMIYWGNANLNNNTLDMTVAIPDETLLSLHLVPVSFKPGNGIQIPITGPMDNPKVETTGALAKLAGAGVSTYGKDPQLQIFGALIQAAVSAVDSGKTLPPATTTPFPWETSQRK